MTVLVPLRGEAASFVADRAIACGCCGANGWDRVVTGTDCVPDLTTPGSARGCPRASPAHRQLGEARNITILAAAPLATQHRRSQVARDALQRTATARKTPSRRALAANCSPRREDSASPDSGSWLASRLAQRPTAPELLGARAGCARPASVQATFPAWFPCADAPPRPALTRNVPQTDHQQHERNEESARDEGPSPVF